MTAQSVSFETLARLPSEAVIHFVNFLAIALLAVGYSILPPSCAVLFGEDRWRAGIVFCVSLTLAFLLAVVLWYRWLSRPSALEEFPAAGAPAFRAVVQEELLHAMGDGARLPRLCWSPTNMLLAARVAGRRSDPALSAGLVASLPKAPYVVRFYLLHEFAHLRQADLELLRATQAVHRSWFAVTGLACMATAGLLVSVVEDPRVLGLVLFVAALWIATLVVVGIMVARYASVMVAFRELDADARALAWRPEMRSSLGNVFDPSAARRGRRNLASLLSPRITHLSSAERLRLLREPQRLLLPKFRYFASVAVLLLLLQSSPFLAGYGYTPLRVGLLFPWALACLAYCASISRCASGMAMEGRAMGALSVAKLTTPAILLFLIPSLTIGDIFMGAFTAATGDGSPFHTGPGKLLHSVREIATSPWSYGS